eukprot:3828344-Rhodomonas_salina.1
MSEGCVLKVSAASSLCACYAPLRLLCDAWPSWPGVSLLQESVIERQNRYINAEFKPTCLRRVGTGIQVPRAPPQRLVSASAISDSGVTMRDCA